MKKTIYIIPGLGSTCNEHQYSSLALALSQKGFDVRAIHPDWKAPLSTQTFAIKRHSLIIAHSMGVAIAGRLAKGSDSRLLLLSPSDQRGLRVLEYFLRGKMGKAKAKVFVDDFKEITLPKAFTVAGMDEDLEADIYIDDVTHRITRRYRDFVVGLVSALY